MGRLARSAIYFHTPKKAGRHARKEARHAKAGRHARKEARRAKAGRHARSINNFQADNMASGR